jgi:hypothetical protein
MRAKMDKHLNPQEDRVRIYLICDACLSKIETIGIPEPVEDTSREFAFSRTAHLERDKLKNYC